MYVCVCIYIHIYMGRKKKCSLSPKGVVAAKHKMSHSAATFLLRVLTIKATFILLDAWNDSISIVLLPLLWLCFAMIGVRDICLAAAYAKRCVPYACEWRVQSAVRSAVFSIGAALPLRNRAVGPRRLILNIISVP